MFIDVAATPASIMTHFSFEVDEAIIVVVMVIVMLLCFCDDGCLRLEILL
jgi:hypothetical protein